MTIDRIGFNGLMPGEVSSIQDDTITVEAAKKTGEVSSVAPKQNEDELVELSFDGEEVQNKTTAEILQENYTLEYKKYLEYQQELASLNAQKLQLQTNLQMAEEGSELANSLQTNITKVDGLIDKCNKNIQACYENMSDLIFKINQAIFDQIMETYRAIAEQSASVGATVEVPELTETASPVSYDVSSVPYSGEQIPKDLAARLDKKLGQGFSAKLESTAAIIGCNANDLIAMMYSESGLNPKAGNPNGGAVGLIQFMPSTLKGNGYTTEQVANMSAVQQLDVVADIMLKSKVMSGYSKNEKIDAGTLYAINFLPAVAKKDVLCTTSDKLSWAYKANSPLDKDHDGAITKADLAKRLQEKYQEAYKHI